MIEFGKTLRTARETKGLSVSQIAESTHMLVHIIEGLENEDFSKIVAPIYGRGFVKLYCEAVGLNPKPLIDEFMEIYSGNREPVIRERAVSDQPPPPVPQVQQPDIPPAPASFAASEVSPTETPAADPVAASPVADKEPPRAPEFDFSSSPSRYAAPMPIDKKPRFQLPGININWRIAVLALAALLVVYLFFTGIRALYRATMTDAPSDETASANTSEIAREIPAESPVGIKAAKRQESLPLKPFYLD